MAYQLKRIHNFLNLKNSNIRSAYEAIFLQLHLDKTLKDENFLIVKFSEDYYEYVKFQLEDTLYEVKYQHFSSTARRFEELQAIDKILSSAGDLLRVKYIEDPGYIEQAIKTYITRKHEITDFLLLDVLPFSIKVFNGAQQIVTAPQHMVIPSKTKPARFIPNDPKIKVSLQMAKKEISMEFPLGFHKGETVEAYIDIDSGFSADLVISGKRVEI